MDDDSVRQMRDQVWENRREIAAVESRVMQRITAISDEFHARVGPLENHIANETAQHARTPQWVFGIISAIGTIVAVLVALRGAGIL